MRCTQLLMVCLAIVVLVCLTSSSLRLQVSRRTLVGAERVCSAVSRWNLQAQFCARAVYEHAGTWSLASRGTEGGREFAILETMTLLSD